MRRSTPWSRSARRRGSGHPRCGDRRPLDAVREAAGEGAAETDLGGGALLPGFIDAHHHYCYAVLDHGSPSLRLPQGSSIDDLLTLIKDAVGSRPPGWVYLCGFEASDLRERRAPRADELEQCCRGRPLFVQAANGHQGVVNKSGLEALGWAAGAADPENGQIVRRRGRPSGELIESAAFIAEAAFRDQIVEAGPDRWLSACEAHGRRLLSLGITRVGDAAVAPSIERLYRRAASEGRLPVTVHAMPVASTNLLLPRFDGGPTGSGHATAPVGPAKLFLDGGHRCAMVPHGETGRRGVGGAAAQHAHRRGAGRAEERAQERTAQPRPRPARPRRHAIPGGGRSRRRRRARRRAGIPDRPARDRQRGDRVGAERAGA